MKSFACIAALAIALADPTLTTDPDDFSTIHNGAAADEVLATDGHSTQAEHDSQHDSMPATSGDAHQMGANHAFDYDGSVGNIEDHAAVGLAADTHTDYTETAAGDFSAQDGLTTHMYHDEADGQDSNWKDITEHGGTYDKGEAGFVATDNQTDATAYPTKAPTMAPSYNHGTCEFTNAIYGAAKTVPVGWHGEGAGNFYCEKYECTSAGLERYKCSKGVAVGDAPVCQKESSLPSAPSDATCGIPTQGNETGVCVNLNCTFTNNMVQVHIVKQSDVNQTHIDGEEHHCKYNQHSQQCTCYCHGAAGKLWHSYEDWYCNKNVELDDGYLAKRIDYTNGTYLGGLNGLNESYSACKSS